jgi:TPR repeat protein
MLATMYEKGLGVGADPAEAAKWRTLAERATS